MKKLFMKVLKTKNNFYDKYKQISKAANKKSAIIGVSFLILDGITRHRTRFYFYFIERYLYKTMREEIRVLKKRMNQYHNDQKNKKFQFCDKIPIWVCWLQGEEEMPELVHMCYKRLKKMAPDIADVVLITKENISNYVSLNSTIMERYEKKILSHTNFTDYIRVKLLSIYGGMWIDSTVYVSSEITSELLNKTFYSQKTRDRFYITHYATRSKWASWLIICSANSLLFKFCEKMMESYYLKSTGIIDYYIIDYFVLLAYHSFTEVKNLVDKVELNNIYAFELVKILNEPYNSIKMNSILSRNQFNKLTHKIPMDLVIKGKQTNYAILLEEQKGVD